jgi:hypothetical protein
MSAQAWFLTSEVLSGLGTTLVIVGLFKEYGTDVLKFWGAKDLRAQIEIETASKRKGSAMVVLGIAIELAGAIGIFATSLKIETDHRGEIATLENETQKLRTQLAWRTLTKEQRDALATRMKPFKGQRIDAVSYLGDAEAEELADQIVGCLKSAGLDAESFKVMELSKLMHGARVETAGPTPVLMQGPFPNSKSVVRQALTPEAKRAADVLDAFLRAQHIVTEPMAPMFPRDLERGTWKQITESPVRVMVGIKPR